MKAGAFRAGIVLSIVTVVTVLAACAGDSAEERICEAANGCGALASDSVPACISTLADIDADRALEECADCLEASTCAQIAAGSCTAQCAAFAGAFDDGGSGVDGNKRPGELTAAERTQFCTWAIEQTGGENAEETCSADVTASNGTVAECTADIGQIACNITVGQIETCFAACNSPCDIFTAPECATFRSCLGA
jgi:hypothetical protein